jgi:hypothetical protein
MRNLERENAQEQFRPSTEPRRNKQESSPKYYTSPAVEKVPEFRIPVPDVPP